MKECMRTILLALLVLLNIAYAQDKKVITLEDIFKKSTFRLKSVSDLRSLKDGKTYASIETDQKTGEKYVAKNNYHDGKIVEVLFKEKEIKFIDSLLPINTNFSEDESKVLLSRDHERIYRHSFKANYFVYDWKMKQMIEVSSKGKQQFATISPDGTKVAFVRDNNLFVKNLVTSEELQVTSDGKPNYIINGGS